MKKINLLLVLFLCLVFAFFYKFFLWQNLPIPSDTIVGLYHPFRDFYAADYPNGIPFKNFLITDPVRQIYPWKDLIIEALRGFSLPSWNPYEMAGKPLLANFQSGVFYPLNFILFVKPFFASWSIFILLQPVLAGFFMLFYLRSLGIGYSAVFLGTIVFAFSGFSIAWMEWGTIGNVALWLPLVLLSIDKIFYPFLGISSAFVKDHSKYRLRNFKLKTRDYIWPGIFVFSLISSFFAGHLQTFFYLFLFTLVYLVARLFQSGKSMRKLKIFVICYLLFAAITFVQWGPTLKFILLSARSIDQSLWTKEGWFIPWQNLIQFIAPDFFGNPATLNYWGVWNYAEFVGYVGIIPLIFALFGLFRRFDKKTLFFGIAFFVSLIFSLPTFFAKIPYWLDIPFFSTAQPTRLLFITDFSLAVLASLGFDYFLRQKRGIFYSFGFVGVVLGGLWVFVIFGVKLQYPQNLIVSRNNLILPTAVFLASFFFTVSISRFSRVAKIASVLRFAIVILAIFDLLRFGFKFTPFTKKEYLFPKTQVLNFLQNQKQPFRIAASDLRILPPNFSTYYRLQSIEGYDPLYLLSYAKFVAALERGNENILPPFGFNRIITPHNLDSKFIDLLNVKYALSQEDLISPKFSKVFQEGQTRIYENKDVLERAFFVQDIIFLQDEQETLRKMFLFDLRNIAIVDKEIKLASPVSKGRAEIISYKENKITIRTVGDQDGFLVLTDVYYPTWKVLIDGKKDIIYKTNFTFRGVFVPKGEHEIVFYNSLF